MNSFPFVASQINPKPIMLPSDNTLNRFEIVSSYYFKTVEFSFSFAETMMEQLVDVNLLCMLIVKEMLSYSEPVLLMVMIHFLVKENSYVMFDLALELN